MVGEHFSNGIEQDDYSTALTNFWSGRRQTALEFLTTTLTNNPHHHQMFEMYRLWIEILATEHRNQSMAMLLEHLQMRGIIETEQSNTFAALRAFIHLELDEHQAVALYKRSLEEAQDNPYVCEFFALSQSRLCEEVEEKNLKVLSESGDYFHQKRVFVSYKLANKAQQIKSSIEFIKKSFPETTLAYHYKLQSSWDAKDWKSAKEQARSLVNLYPGNIENYILLGLCSLKLKHTEDALKALEAALNMGGAHDPDVLSLLGQTYDSLKGKSENTHEIHEFSLKCLLSAQKTLQRMGHNTINLECLISRVNTFEESYTDSPKIFMVKLDSRNYYEFKNANVDDIDNLNLPLSKQLTPGDFCFISTTTIGASKNKKTKPLRIAGLYEICGDPVYRLDGTYFTPCQLVHKPAHSISIEVAFENKDRRSRNSFSCFELNDAAIDLITEEIQFRNYSEEIDTWSTLAPLAKAS